MAELEPCQDCGFPSWRPGVHVHFDESAHCLAHRFAEFPQTPVKFLLACRDRTIARLRAELVAASAETFGQCCVTAVAAHTEQIQALRVQVDRLTTNAKRACKVLSG